MAASSKTRQPPANNATRCKNERAKVKAAFENTDSGTSNAKIFLQCRNNLPIVTDGCVAQDMAFKIGLQQLRQRNGGCPIHLSFSVTIEPYAKLKIDFGWLNAAHPVDANDSQ